MKIEQLKGVGEGIFKMENLCEIRHEKLESTKYILGIEYSYFPGV
jgi:hypothetical protein